MDKDEYLTRAHDRIEELIEDPVFLRHLAQVRARAVLEEPLSEPIGVDFTFVPEQISQYCDFIFSESGLLLREGAGAEEVVTGWMQYPARAFEFLARFAEEDEKERLLLNAAMCYHIAGYQANAQCLASLLDTDFEIGTPMDAEDAAVDGVLAELFRHAVIRFLRRDIAALLPTTAEALSVVRGFQEATVRNIEAGASGVAELSSLTGHAYFHQAIADFVQYCLYGDQEQISAAYAHAEKSYRCFLKARDATLGAVTSELRTVLDQFKKRSTWFTISAHAGSLLGNPVWQVYLQNLAFEKSTVEFWLSQLTAIRSGLLTSEDSYIVQMPTSSGKTLIAELAILGALTSREGVRCLYIAPYRALANEIENALSETLGAVGYRVSNLLGGFEFDAFQDFLLGESQVLVATPEKIDLFLRIHPEYFDSLAIVVVDEGHIVDEGVPQPDPDTTLLTELKQTGTLGRGPLLEFLITRLKRKVPGVRFIFLSAVMPEVSARDFVNWLSKEKQGPLRIDSRQRPSRQLIAKFEWRSAENGELEYLTLARLANGRRPWVPAFIRRKQYLTGELTRTGRPEKRSWPNIRNKAQTTAMLAIRSAKADPVLVFCATKPDVRSVVDNLVTSLKYLEASNELPNQALGYVENPDLESYQLALDWLGESHPLTQALHHGVGLHYGPLPDSVRQAVEDEFRRERIRILVSTNTLGQGVNLPVKTAIIYSVERRWPELDEHGEAEIHTEKVKKRDFWNICGRAGRAGKETEGQVIFVAMSDNDKSLLAEFTAQANLEEVDSALFRLLRALVDNRISESELIGYLDSHVLAILAEEIVDTRDEAAVREFLGTSLVGVQALRTGTDLQPLVSAIQYASAWVVDQVSDLYLRRVFASTGLRVQSCLSLDEAARSFLSKISEDTLKNQEEQVEYSEDLLRTAFYACQDLPEMQLSRSVDYYGPDDEFEIVSRWIQGSSVGSIRADLWDADKSEDFSQYIADRVVYKLPWGFNGFLRILAHRMSVDLTDLPIAWQQLPFMIKFGVGNVVACWGSSLGISSRQLALDLAKKYQPETRPLFADFVRWLVDLPHEFVVLELDGSLFEKQRLLENVQKLVASTEFLQLGRATKGSIDSLVQGIQYKGRYTAASRVRVGDWLGLQAEPDNAYDPRAVRVLFEGQHIGYVQRQIAWTISRELLLRREVQAYAKSVRPATAEYPIPAIVATIEFVR